MYCKNCQKQYPFQDYCKKEWEITRKWKKPDSKTFFCSECGRKFESKGWRTVVQFILQVFIDVVFIKLFISLAIYFENVLIFVRNWPLWQLIIMLVITCVIYFLVFFILHIMSFWFCLTTNDKTEQTENDPEEQLDSDAKRNKGVAFILKTIFFFAVLLVFLFFTSNSIAKDVAAVQANPINTWSKAQNFYQANDVNLQKAADDMMRDSYLVMITSDVKMIIKDGYGDDKYSVDSIGGIWFVYAYDLKPKYITELEDTTAFQLVKNNVLSGIYVSTDNDGQKIIHLVNLNTDKAEFGFKYLYSGTIDPKTATVAYVVKPIETHWYWYKSVNTHIRLF